MKRQAKPLDIVDQMLKYAAELRMDDMAKETQIPEEIADHTYSAEFDNGMNTYFKKLKRKNAYKRAGKVLSRVAVILLAFIAVSTTVVMSVDALRVPALEFFGQTEDGTYSAYVVDASEYYDAYKEEIHDMFLPTYLPEGYKVNSIDRVGHMYTVIYTNDSDGFIMYENLIEGSSVGVAGTQKEVSVKDGTGQYFSFKDQSTLLFKYQKNAFMLGGTIEEVDAVHMADSLQYFK